MKKYKFLLILFLLIGGIQSCDQDEILTETPKDFLSPENSFTDKAGFEAALANIYLTIRTNLYAQANSHQNYDLMGVGIDLANLVHADSYDEYFYWNTFNADNARVKVWWKNFYNWIFQANVIIGRTESDVVSWASEEEKNAIIGEAKFIRAFGYHFLANMWGGVPLVLEETTAAKFNYTRDSQEAVYQQCKQDLEFAVQYMPTVDQLKGGRAPRAAAYHLLSEINICLGDYDSAITAASKVIDDPNFYLMTERFGQWTNFTFNGYDYQGEAEPWGDVYWDLFQEGNMNWLEGNHEAIWNVEFEYNAIGSTTNFVLERWWAGPNYYRYKDKNGITNWLKDTLGGQPLAGWDAVPYIDSLIWKYKGDWNNDIRNSEYNVQRTYYWTNPSSEFYGQAITPENIDPSRVIDGTRFNHETCLPTFKKAIGTLHHGANTDGSSGQIHDNGSIYKDWYVIRLAETYLLRAEAYMRKGNTEKAADDINAVRNRSKATAVTSGDVDLDLILQERSRELHHEEFRISTLTRCEKLTEYLMKYNQAVVQAGYTLGEHLNKMPIPNAEIEANKEAVLEQNPGY